MYFQLFYLFTILYSWYISIISCNDILETSTTCDVEYDEFNTNRLDILKITNNSFVEQRINGMLDLIVTYQHQHGMKALLYETNQQLCSRKYIVNMHSTFTCDENTNHVNHAIGSTTLIFLTEFATALILNRTLILGPRDDLDHQCNKFIRIKQWIPTFDYIHSRLQNARCPKNIVERSNIFGVCTFFNDKNDPKGFYRNRVKLLFPDPLSPTIPVLNKYREGYGYLFRAAISFTSYTREIITPLVQDIYQPTSYSSICIRRKDVVTIGVHLRHPHHDGSITEQYDKLAIEHIDNILRVQSHKYKCILLVSTDRYSGFELMMNYGNKTGCIVKFTPRDEQFQNTSTHHVFLQHGHYAGVQVYLDLLLLSHSKYFIGSDSSLLSGLMSNFIMTRLTPYNFPDYTFFYVPVTDGSIFMYEYPCIHEKVFSTTKIHRRLLINITTLE